MSWSSELRNLSIHVLVHNLILVVVIVVDDLIIIVNSLLSICLIRNDNLTLWSSCYERSKNLIITCNLCRCALCRKLTLSYEREIIVALLALCAGNNTFNSDCRNSCSCLYATSKNCPLNVSYVSIVRVYAILSNFWS